MREAQIRVAAEWQRADLLAVRDWPRIGPAVAGRPDHPPRRGGDAERPTAPPSATSACLKMVLDWRGRA
jgi:3-hydroxyethyl bacteriochlorophyllide a dehydrogenase